MTKKDYLYLGAIVVLLIVCGLAISAWHSAEVDKAKADQVKQDVQQQIADLRKDLKEQLAVIQKDRETVKTPAQVAQAVPRYIEGVRPILIVPGGVPTSTSDVSGQIPSISLPDAPSAISVGSLVIPSEQVPAYWKSVTKCAEDSLRLTECQKEIPLLEKRAEAAETSLKGGGFWTRLRRNAKWLGVGIGIGAAAGIAASR